MRILHASFLVSNLEAAHRFYTDVLGLNNLPRPDLGFSGAWYGLEGGQQIHLMQLPGAGEEQSGHGGRDRHVAFSVEDLDALVLRLVKADIAYTTSRSGRSAVFCRDPDGNALEFVQS